MGAQFLPLEVNDFSGGFTDNFVNAPINQAEIVDNFLVQENKSIITRPGSHIQDATNAPIIPAGNQRISVMVNYDENDKLFVLSGDEIYYRATDASAYTTLTGPSSNDIFPNASTTNHTAYAEWKKHVFFTNDVYDSPKKMYKDSGGTYRLRTAGLPDLASAPTVTPGAAGSRTYLYAFIHHYTYTAGSQEFQDFGPVTFVEVTNSGDPSVSDNDVTSIPVLANSTTESWDTTAIKIFIYRSIDGGSTLYKSGEVTNGTTTFADVTSDDDIQLNEVLYTDGDVLENDPPPLAKYLTIVNNTGYYGHLKEGTEILTNVVKQSAPFDPDSVPAANLIEVDDDITGLGSVQSIPMILCRKRIFRVDGAYNELGQGAPVAVRINDTAGCVSHNSIVQAKDYVFWMGNDKFYASDGYKVIPISDHFNERFKASLEAAVDPENIVGSYDEQNERIYWTIQEDAGSGDHDTLWVLDLRWGITKNSSFTSWTGGTSFAPSSIVFFNDELIRADSRGYVFVHSSTDTADPKVDTTLAPTAWQEQAIVWDYKGFATNFGTDAARKWVTRLFLTAVNVSNVTIGMKAFNDDGRSEREFTPIRYRANFVWGDQTFTWRDPEFVWNSQGLIQEQRRFPKGGLRCSYLQMGITNAEGVVANSDVFGDCTVTPGAGTSTAVIISATFVWPSDSVDYFIAFEDSNYTTEYLITARTASTLTFQDSLGTAPTGTQSWVIRGIRKNEVFNLLAYTVMYSPISQSQSMFETGQSGENTA